MIPSVQRPLPCTTAPNLFFPPDGERSHSPEHLDRLAEAQKLCRACPIAEACRQEPRPGELGVWGGLDEYDRAKLSGVRVRRDRVPQARPQAVCGTTGGEAKHRRLKQRVCEPCKAAARVDAANRRAKRALDVAA